MNAVMGPPPVEPEEPDRISESAQVLEDINDTLKILALAAQSIAHSLAWWAHDEGYTDVK